MTDDETLRQAVHRDMGYEPPNASFAAPGFLTARMATTSTSARSRSARREVPLGLVAVVVAIAIIATLLIGAHQLRPRTAPVGAVPGPRLGTSVIPIGSGNLSPTFGRNSFAYTTDDAVEVSAGGHPLITHDGGKSWLSSPATFFFGSMEWIDARHIYFWGLNTNRNVPGGTIFEETSDGGAHWQFITPYAATGGPFDPTNSFFINPIEGWTLQYGCEACAIYHSVDGGTNWKNITGIGTSTTSPAAGLVFTSASLGFVGSANHDGVGRLFRTTDGGNAWRLIDMPAPPQGWPGGVTVTQLPQLFGSSGVVVVKSELGSSWVYRTTDGGLTWSEPRQLPMNLTGSALPNFSGMADGWVVDAKGTLFRTADIGITWTAVIAHVPDGLSLIQATPVGDTVLWGIAVSGNSRFAVKSSDGGLDWAYVKLPAG